MINATKYFKPAVFLLTAIMICSQASAFQVCLTNDGHEFVWPQAEVTYYINTTGGPYDTLPAIEAGMQTWMDVGSSNFTFLVDSTTNPGHAKRDQENIIAFGLLDIGTVAKSWSWSDDLTDTSLENDILFNNYYSWSTDGSSGTYDVHNIATHELGHALCLVDLYSPADANKTMYGIVATGETKKQSLDVDDINGITYLYPCPYDELPVWIPGVSSEYSSIQDAYIDAGNGEAIQLQATAFEETLLFNIAKSVVIEGRYNCDYTNRAGVTIIRGDITISSGTVTIGGIVLE